MFYICCYNLVIFMNKNDKLKKHLNFCVKYPETVIGADDSVLMVQYMIDNNITPIVDCFRVGRMDGYYKLDSNVFVKFKDIIKDWNNMIPSDANKNY